MVGTHLPHEVTNGRDPICTMRLPTVGSHMQHEVTNGRVPMCSMKLLKVRILYVT